MSNYFNFIELTSTIYVIVHNIDLTKLNNAIGINETSKTIEKKNSQKPNLPKNIIQENIIKMRKPNSKPSSKGIDSKLKSLPNTKKFNEFGINTGFTLKHKRNLNDNSFIADFWTKWFNLSKRKNREKEKKSFTEFMKDFIPRSTIMNNIIKPYKKEHSTLDFNSNGNIIQQVVKIPIKNEVKTRLLQEYGVN